MTTRTLKLVMAIVLSFFMCVAQMPITAFADASDARLDDIKVNVFTATNPSGVLGQLSPGFDQNETDYELYTGPDGTEVLFEIKKKYEEQSLKLEINGEVVMDSRGGQGSSLSVYSFPKALTQENNLATITVTSTDGNVEVYDINIIKADRPLDNTQRPNDTRVNNILPMAKQYGQNNVIPMPLSPVFDDDSYEYEMNVDNTVEKVAFAVQLKDNSQDMEVSVGASNIATHQVGTEGRETDEITLTGQTTMVFFFVKAADGTTGSPYSVKIKKSDMTTKLASIEGRVKYQGSGTNDLVLSPAFNPNIKEYEAIIDEDVTRVSLSVQMNSASQVFRAEKTEIILCSHRM